MTVLNYACMRCNYLNFSDLARLKFLKQERRSRTRKFHIVTEAWVRACMEEGSTVNERAFEPVFDT